MPGCFFCFVLAVTISNGELPSALKTSNGDEKGVLFSASPFFSRHQNLFCRQSHTPLASLPVWASHSAFLKYNPGSMHHA
jgi:hypothetical protein